MQDHLFLWNKMQSFSIDDGIAQGPFSARLAANRDWSMEFTHRAIEEYKKFILLCCISEKGASPSKIVDDVWHLHLTYTRSYWIDFCRNTLGKDIHHHLSAAGARDDRKHREWYRETLQLYRTVFGSDPPSDIWPPPLEWPVPQDPPLHFDGSIMVALVVILLTPFLFIGVIFHTFSPFMLSGPQFLEFFSWYGSAILISYIIYRWQIKRKIESLVAAYFPNDVTAFQMAVFLYGKHRALQAGVLDLINRELMEVTSENYFRVKKRSYKADPKETNPLIPVYAGMPDGSVHSYKIMLDCWYDLVKFSHEGLEALHVFAKRREPFLRRYPFHIAFFSMVVARACQGIQHGQPIVYLLLQTLVICIPFFIAIIHLSKSTLVYKKINRLFKERRLTPGSLDDRMLKQFALEGFPAINGSAEGLLLAGIFAVYTPRHLRNTWNEWNKSIQDER